MATGATLALAALQTARSQQASPVSEDEVSILFVLTAAEGSITDGAGDYTLTLRGHTGQTICFSDRPERMAGIVRTPDLVANWPFATDSPPNAAVTFDDLAIGSLQVIVCELHAVAWNDVTRDLTCSCRPIAVPSETAFTNNVMDPTPATFDSASLFIDSAMLSSDINIDVFINGYHKGKPIHGT